MRRRVAGLMVLRSPLNNNMECSMCGLDDPFVLLIMASRNCSKDDDAVWVDTTWHIDSASLPSRRKGAVPGLLHRCHSCDCTNGASAKISYPNDIAGQRACSYNCLRHVSAPRFRTGIESVPEAIVVPVKDRSGWLAIWALAAQGL